MTLDDLNLHRCMVQELNNEREQLAIIKAKALGATNMDGMPHGSAVGDKTASLALLISASEKRIAEMEKRVADSQAHIMQYIDRIQDSKTYYIFFYRFIMNYEWGEVANLVGKFISEDSVKNTAYTYIKEHYAFRQN